MERTHNFSHRASQDFARAPRRRIPRRRPPLRPWMKHSLLVLLIAMMLAISVVAVIKIVRPYREARQQSQQLARNRAKLAAIRAQNAELRQRIAYLKTDDGQTTEARKLGFVRPGEIPIVVEDTSAPSAPAASPAAPRTPHSAPHSFWGRWAGRH